MSERDLLDELDEVVTCRYCGRKTLYGEMIWLNGKEMCPSCYMNERAAEDARLSNEKEVN